MNPKELERFRWHAASRIYAGYVAARNRCSPEMKMSLTIAEADRFIAELQRTAPVKPVCKHERWEIPPPSIPGVNVAYRLCLDCGATL